MGLIRRPCPVKWPSFPGMPASVLPQSLCTHCPLYLDRLLLFFTSWTPAYASHLCLNITSSDPKASLGPATMCPEVTFWFFLLSTHQLVCMCAKLLQSCLTLWDPMDCSPPASSVHGILQARKLEWVAMPSCSGSSQTRDWTCVSYVACTGRQVLYHGSHLGSPLISLQWCISRIIHFTCVSLTRLVGSMRAGTVFGWSWIPGASSLGLLCNVWAPHKMKRQCPVQKAGKNAIRDSQTAFPFLLCFLPWLVIAFTEDWRVDTSLLVLPKHGVRVQSLGGVLRPLHVSQPKHQNRKHKQYCNKFNKDFKNGPHQK